MSAPSLAETEVTFANLLDKVEELRLYAYDRLDPEQRGPLGQYFTPAPVAKFMADFFETLPEEVALLDPGAGAGMLTSAFVLRALGQNPRPKRIEVTAYEVDPRLIPFLRESMSFCEALCRRCGTTFSAEVVEGDYIESVPPCLENGPLFGGGQERFDCVIMNPPYKKMHSDSTHRRTLSSHGLETVNLYTGFLWMAAKDLKAGGQLVAIHPRSFANGPYYRPFRRAFMDEVNIRRVHVFNSRSEAFQEDEVLQENVIQHVVKEPSNAPVRITVSDHLEDPAKECLLPREDFCNPADPDLFIHLIADDYDLGIRRRMRQFTHTLQDLGIVVSTGRVVDFRAKEFLQKVPSADSVPLIYPGHCQNGRVVWPREGFRKCNWFRRCPDSASQLVPPGDYVLVRRFTAKEEKRRLAAYLISAEEVPARAFAFENHLNYFHEHGKPLAPDLAKGIATFLNSSLADSYFRQFNGHTQVNATDLRSLRYPSRDQLVEVCRGLGSQTLDTPTADRILDKILPSMPDDQTPDPALVKKKIDEALDILKQLDVPRAQQNERSALTLLALLGQRPKAKWSESKRVFIGITQMMDWFRNHFGVTYAPNTRETVRRQTIHQFVEMGLAVPNSDQPDRPVNSPFYGYEIESSALELIRTYRTRKWKQALTAYMESVDSLRVLHHQEREMNRIEVRLPDGSKKWLSAGGQNVLIKAIVEEFCPRFTPGGYVCYLGDAGKKISDDEKTYFRRLGVELDPHGKMPDVVVYLEDRNWLVLIEAVTSHGPIDNKRKRELQKLFAGCTAGLVFITAFPTRKAMLTFFHEISWETDVWLAENPSHLIHFDGEKFLGPYDER
ncbi:MAG: Eco57I restriction-modification methylase domain-containing protein [Opitutales bacterium]|nr:Eco57I restriction-modification methylase domain-containing protein [Opitutales bacterium]